MAERNDGPPEKKTTLPAFEIGGMVRETGIALVHQGEFILPAPGSEAVIEPAPASTESEINYHFPVEIEVIGTLSQDDYQAIETRIWDKLNDALERLA